MSRIGKQTIELPEKVTVTLVDDELAVVGPRGELKRAWPHQLTLAVEPNAVSGRQVVQTSVKKSNRVEELAALWGTYTAHLKNMVNGVINGFEKRLIVEGVGYRVEVKNVSGKEALILNVGFSHPVPLPVPLGLKVVVEKNLIIVSGIDREAVGHFASKIKLVRPPDAYKEKGIRYDGEVVIRKQAKKAVA